MENFNIKIDLLKLKNSFVTNIKGKTETKRCLVIPIDDCNLFVGEKGIYLNLSAIKMKEQKYDDTHVIKQNLSKEVYTGLTEEERKELPIIGSMKPAVFEQKQMDVRGEVIVDDVDIDLPF